MKTSLFASSKNALVFAGSIIVGTIILVDSNSGDNAGTAATRDNEDGRDSYRRLMERKHSSRRRIQEVPVSNFVPEDGFEELDEPDADAEIGDYAPPSHESGGESSSSEEFRPGIDGPNT